MAWIKKTKGNIEAAAKSNPSAHTQFLLIDYKNPKLLYATMQYVMATQSVRPDGWREHVRVLEQLGSAAPAESRRRDALRALLDGAKGDDDARQKTSVARVVLRYSTDEHVRAEARALLDQAASKGDLGALLQKWEGLRSAERAAMVSVLDQGALAGSRQLLYERGAFYEREGKPQAKQDFLHAAKLGHWDAMMSYRGHDNYGDQKTIVSDDFVVLPMPAALAMHLQPATVVFSSGSTPLAKNGIEKGATGNQVRWPDLSSLAHDAAIRELRESYARIFATAAPGWVILEPIDAALFGNHNKYDLTARAILYAPRDRISVALCVSAELSEVSLYDGAFSAARTLPVAPELRIAREPLDDGDFDALLDASLRSRAQSFGF
jgi:hypothetical protein